MSVITFLGTEFQHWLLRASWQAAVLAILILVAQALLGKRLTPAWRYRLWLLVVVRLVLPFQASSPTSVHNLARLPGPVSAPGLQVPWVIPDPPRAAPTVPVVSHRTDQEAVGTRGVATATGEESRRVEAGLESATTPTRGARSRAISVREVWMWFWLAGAVVLAVRIVVQNLRFRWSLEREATPVEPGVATHLEACRQRLGVRTPIRAMETTQVQSPAVYGFVRPTLLLPRGLAAEFSVEQLRHVLLHEVAHVKRGDMAMTWVMVVLQVLHWFNPVLWLAFARMRVDRELACDALVLGSSRDGEAAGYGETIIRVLEAMNRGGAMPGLVGILEDKEQIRERIRMIAAFRRPSRTSAFAVLLLAGLGWVGLTDAAPSAKPLPPVVPLTITNLLVKAENQAWSEESVWKVPPRGSNVFGGIEFHLDGMIQLFGTGPEADGRKYRERVVIPMMETHGTGSTATVIQRGTNIGSLHLVGGTAYDAPAETKIAEVIWRYTDGTFKRSPILYGVHLRDWWRTKYEEPARLPGPHTKVIWRGIHPDAERWGGKTLRLYRLSLANPEPTRVVRQLELVSARARPAVLILGMTLDPLKPGERPDATPDLEEVDPEPTGHLMVTVQNAEGLPLRGAEIRIQVKSTDQQGNGTAYPKVFRTDAQGLADVSIPAEGVERLQITVSKDEFSSRKVVWDTKTGDVLPSAHMLKLRGAIQLGGTVVDPDGNPVAGATVTLNRFWMGGERSPSKGDETEFAPQEHVTGSDGQWKAGNVPPELLHRIGIAARHPDYIEARTLGETDPAALMRLKDGTHVLTLLRGLDVHGRVTSDRDEPIADATVWSGERDFADRKQTKTDVEGRFTFRNVKAGRTLFSAMATSREPATQYQTVGADMPEVVFRLAAGSVIRARVQNAEGDPLAGVRVALEGAGDIGRTYEFSTQTDGDGRFEWDSAPDKPMQFYFGAAGYEQKRNHVLSPGQDNVVILKKKRTVYGQVVDATSGEPLIRFEVAAGRLHAEGPESFYADYPGLAEHSQTEGRFQIELDEESTNAIQVESDDHAGRIEKLPDDENGVIRLTLKLEPSSGLRGVVVDGAGRPVPGAHLSVTSPPLKPGASMNMVTLIAGRLSVQWRQGIVTADDSGQFTVPSPPLGGMVLAAHESGFASMPIDAVRSTGRLVLQPYGRIEGTLSVLGEPVVGAGILLGLSSMGVQADFNTYRTTTDSQGRFVLTQVPPGRVGVIRLIEISPSSWAHGQEVPVAVEPGQTARITLGDSGAVVRGRVRFETPSTESGVVVSGSLSSAGPKIPEPLTEDLAKAFFASPEWLEHQKNQKHYPVRMGADGSVRLDSVAPGKYTLSLSASVPGDHPWNDKTTAHGSAEVTIPMEADPMTAIEVGEVVLKPIPKP